MPGTLRHVGFHSFSENGNQPRHQQQQNELFQEETHHAGGVVPMYEERPVGHPGGNDAPGDGWGGRHPPVAQPAHPEKENQEAHHARPAEAAPHLGPERRRHAAPAVWIQRLLNLVVERRGHPVPFGTKRIGEGVPVRDDKMIIMGSDDPMIIKNQNAAQK